MVLDLPLTGQELAEMASTTPYTVSRLLAAWRRLDIVDAQHDRILILQPQRLAAIAEEPDCAEVNDPAEAGSPPSNDALTCPDLLRAAATRPQRAGGQLVR